MKIRLSQKDSLILYIAGIFKQDIILFKCPQKILSILVRLYVDELAAFLANGEYHNTVNESEECVIFAHSYIETGMMLGATLTLKNVAGFAV